MTLFRAEGTFRVDNFSRRKYPLAYLLRCVYKVFRSVSDFKLKINSKTHTEIVDFKFCTNFGVQSGKKS